MEYERCSSPMKAAAFSMIFMVYYWIDGFSVSERGG